MNRGVTTTPLLCSVFNNHFLQILRKKVDKISYIVYNVCSAERSVFYAC